MKVNNNGNLTITLEGRLDAVTAPELPKALENEEYEKLTLEMEKLEYISSAGLRALLLCKKVSDGKGAAMTVRKPSPAVLDVMHMSGFDRMLDIQEE